MSEFDREEAYKIIKTEASVIGPNRPIATTIRWLKEAQALLEQSIGADRNTQEILHRLRGKFFTKDQADLIVETVLSSVLPGQRDGR